MAMVSPAAFDELEVAASRLLQAAGRSKVMAGRIAHGLAVRDVCANNPAYAQQVSRGKSQAVSLQTLAAYYKCMKALEELSKHVVLADEAQQPQEPGPVPRGDVELVTKSLPLAQRRPEEELLPSWALQGSLSWQILMVTIWPWWVAAANSWWWQRAARLAPLLCVIVVLWRPDFVLEACARVVYGLVSHFLGRLTFTLHSMVHAAAATLTFDPLDVVVETPAPAAATNFGSNFLMMAIGVRLLRG